MILENNWLPEYKITRHRRARYVKFRITSGRQLKITVPYRYNIKELPGILEEHREWIIRQLDKIPSRSNTSLPKEIDFKVVNEKWQLFYVKTNSRLKLIERPNKEIILLGDIADIKACQAVIMKWIKVQTKKYLTELLEKVSIEVGLPFEKLTIRSQSTLWGSCTSKKAISLNYKLIFLPELLAKHVIIHELCHTIYLNHSIKFWNLVAMYDPLWRQHRRELRHADHFIPSWIEK